MSRIQVGDLVRARELSQNGINYIPVAGSVGLVIGEKCMAPGNPDDRFLRILFEGDIWTYHEGVLMPLDDEGA